MKKLLIIMLVLSLFLLVACSSGVDDMNDADDVNDVDDDDVVVDNHQVIDGGEPELDMDEMDNYASYEVAVVCGFADATVAGTEEAMRSALENSVSLAADFGFEDAEIRQLTEKYKDSPEFMALAEEKIQATCPEAYEFMNNPSGE